MTPSILLLVLLLEQRLDICDHRYWVDYNVLKNRRWTCGCICTIHRSQRPSIISIQLQSTGLRHPGERANREFAKLNATPLSQHGGEPAVTPTSSHPNSPLKVHTSSLRQATDNIPHHLNRPASDITTGMMDDNCEPVPDAPGHRSAQSGQPHRSWIAYPTDSSRPLPKRG